MIFWQKALIFGLCTVLLAYISRQSLRSFQRHSFYRFFAWELITVLIMLNLPVWFASPLAWHQVISWALLFLSLYLVIAGVYLLQRAGRPKADRAEEGLLGLEKTTHLVSAGVYRYIRHPMYCSLLCLAWGVFFKSPSWIGVVLALGASLFLVLTAKIEEKENVRYFGEAYRAYQEQTKMFVPFLF